MFVLSLFHACDGRGLPVLSLGHRPMNLQQIVRERIRASNTTGRPYPVSRHLTLLICHCRHCLQPRIELQVLGKHLEEAIATECIVWGEALSSLRTKYKPIR